MSVRTRWRLNGTADYVADADLADVIVVSAAAGERTLVFVVDARAAGADAWSRSHGGRAPSVRRAISTT